MLNANNQNATRGCMFQEGFISKRGQTLMDKHCVVFYWYFYVTQDVVTWRVYITVSATAVLGPPVTVSCVWTFQTYISLDVVCNTWRFKCHRILEYWHTHSAALSRYWTWGPCYSLKFCFRNWIVWNWNWVHRSLLARSLVSTICKRIGYLNSPVPKEIG